MADAAPQVVHTVGEAARGPNSYKTLAECVAAASAGDMVMVLPGVYEERVHIPFPLDVVGRVKGKVRICPPPESALTPQERADAEQLEDELAIAEILHRHGIKQSDHAALSDADLVPPVADELAAAGLALSLQSDPGVAGRLVDIIVDGGGITVTGPEAERGGDGESPPGSPRGGGGSWAFETVHIRNAPADALAVSGGARVALRKCQVGACAGRGCVLSDSGSLDARATEWSEQRGGCIFAGESAQLTMVRCQMSGPDPSQAPDAATPQMAAVHRREQIPITLPTFLVFKRYVNRIRWKLRNHVGQEACHCGHGLLLDGNARARLENCNVRWSPGSGIVASDAASCTLVGGAIASSGEEGLLCCGRAELHMERVDVADAAHAGILLLEHATAELDSCSVEQCRGAGVVASGWTSLTVRGGNIMRNDLSGVRTKGHSVATVERCLIKANGLHAVHFGSFGAGTFTDNQLLVRDTCASFLALFQSSEVVVRAGHGMDQERDTGGLAPEGRRSRLGEARGRAAARADGDRPRPDRQPGEHRRPARRQRRGLRRRAHLERAPDGHPGRG